MSALCKNTVRFFISRRISNENAENQKVYVAVSGGADVRYHPVWGWDDRLCRRRNRRGLPCFLSP